MTREANLFTYAWATLVSAGATLVWDSSRLLFCTATFTACTIATLLDRRP